jgi:polyferredoxin
MKRQNIRKLILLISLLLFPVTINYLSPYLIIEGAANGIASGSLVTFAFLFISSLVIGRLWCSWICPSGAFQSLLIPVNGKEARGGKYNLTKYITWTVWISIIVFSAMSVGGLHTVDFFYQTENIISMDSPNVYFVYYTVITVFLILSLALGKRAGCHYICWMAPFMVIGRKVRNLLQYPSLRLRADTEKCIDCKKCNKVCPMSLDVNMMVSNHTMENSECILCGECIDSCPKDVIGYSFSSGLD